MAEALNYQPMRRKRITYTQEELRLMRSTGVVSPKVPEAEFRLLVLMSEMTGANILLGQIHTVPRWDSDQGKVVYKPQLSVHGLSLHAHDHHDFAGVDPVQFTYKPDGALESASVTVYRMVQGQRCAFTGTAFYDEYLQTNKQGAPSGLWGSKPRRMLEKCAYSNAIRLAYQEMVGGLYTDEEMPPPLEASVTEQREPTPIRGKEQQAIAAPAFTHSQLVDAIKRLCDEYELALPSEDLEVATDARLMEIGKALRTQANEKPAGEIAKDAFKTKAEAAGIAGRDLVVAVPRLLEGLTWASVTYGDLATLEQLLKDNPKQFLAQEGA